MDFYEILLRVLADWLVVPIVIIGAIAVFRLPKKNRKLKIARGVLTGLLALALAKLTANFYQGARPFEELGTDPIVSYLNNPGFPSDHALLVFTIAFVVWAITKNRALSVTLFVLACLVSYGRVAGLVHTPIDIAGSFTVSFLAVLLVYGKSFFSRRVTD